MATTEKYALGSVATLMSTELGNLASSSTLAAGATTAGATGAYNNTQGGGGGDGYTRGDCELTVNYSSSTTPAAGSAAYVYFLRDVDGTNYEYGGASAMPARDPNVIFNFPNVAFTSPYRITIPDVRAPVGNFQTVITHNTGASFPATGNTLKWLPSTRQAV